jgi:YD repeat-containing protein
MVALERQAEERTHNAVNEITSCEGSEGYDAAGNMTDVQHGQDADGGTDFDLVWDAWNRLVKVVDGGTTIRYRYDGLSRRVRKIHGTTSGVVREYHYNSSWQVLEVRKDAKTWTAGQETAAATTVYEQFLWSRRYIDAPVLRGQDTAADVTTTGRPR